MLELAEGPSVVSNFGSEAGWSSGGPRFADVGRRGPLCLSGSLEVWQGGRAVPRVRAPAPGLPPWDPGSCWHSVCLGGGSASRARGARLGVIAFSSWTWELSPRCCHTRRGLCITQQLLRMSHVGGVSKIGGRQSPQRTQAGSVLLLFPMAPLRPLQAFSRPQSCPPWARRPSGTPACATEGLCSSFPNLTTPFLHPLR